MESVLFLGKNGDTHCKRAADFVLNNFDDVSVYFGDWEVLRLIPPIKWDYIISYLSRWIVPGHMLKYTHKAAINFHPAPPEYPGVGCYNFALYDDAPEYGVTCHHMEEKVDTGDIISVKRFPIYPTDNVESLIDRTREYLLVLFYYVMSHILLDHKLPMSDEKWKAEPTTFQDLEQLHEIDPDMSREEVDKRIRATSYNEFQPHLHLGEHRFEYKP